MLCAATVVEDLHYVDFVQTAKEMSKLLKEQGCDYIIALTHMRLPNDRILAEKCQGEVDLILGGHDHASVFEKIGLVCIVKSGSDFKEFSEIKVDLKTREVDRQRVLITEAYQKDPEIERHIS